MRTLNEKLTLPLFLYNSLWIRDLDDVLKKIYGMRQCFQGIKLVAKGSAQLLQCRQDLLDDANFEVFPIPIVRALV